MASAQRRVRERERYAGEWAKDVRAGTGMLTNAHGKAWDVLFSPSGELLWKRAAVALQPITCHQVWGHQSKRAQTYPQEIGTSWRGCCEL